MCTVSKLYQKGWALSLIFSTICLPCHQGCLIYRILSVLLPTNEECRVGFESQNQSFIQTEQPPDGSIPEITAGVAESALLDNKNPKENALFCSN